MLKIRIKILAVQKGMALNSMEHCHVKCINMYLNIMKHYAVESLRLKGDELRYLLQGREKAWDIYDHAYSSMIFGRYITSYINNIFNRFQLNLINNSYIYGGNQVHSEYIRKHFLYSKEILNLNIGLQHGENKFFSVKNKKSYPKYYADKINYIGQSAGDFSVYKVAKIKNILYKRVTKIGEWSIYPPLSMYNAKVFLQKSIKISHGFSDISFHTSMMRYAATYESRQDIGNFSIYQTANINSLLYKRIEKTKEWPVYQDIHNHNIRNISHRFDKAAGLHKFISAGTKQYVFLHALRYSKNRHESLFSVKSQFLYKTFLTKLLQEKHRSFWYEKAHLEKPLGFLYSKAGLNKSLSYISQKNYAYKALLNEKYYAYENRQDTSSFFVNFYVPVLRCAATYKNLLYKGTEKIKEWPVYQNIHNHNIRNISHRFDKAAGLHKFISAGIEKYVALHTLWYSKSRHESLFLGKSQLLYKTFLTKLLQEQHRSFWYEKAHLEKPLGFLYSKAGLNKSLSYISQKNYAPLLRCAATYKNLLYKGTEEIKEWPVYQNIHNHNIRNISHRFDKAAGLHKFISTGIEKYVALHTLWYSKSRHERLFFGKSQLFYKNFFKKFLQEKHRFFLREKAHIEKPLYFLYNKADINKSLSYISQKNYAYKVLLNEKYYAYENRQDAGSFSVNFYAPLLRCATTYESLLYKGKEEIKEWPVYQNIHNHNIRNISYRFDKAAGLPKFISADKKQYVALHALWYSKSRHESLFFGKSQLFYKNFLKKFLQEKHRFFWYEKAQLEKLLDFLYTKADVNKSLSYISQKNYTPLLRCVATYESRLLHALQSPPIFMLRAIALLPSCPSDVHISPYAGIRSIWPPSGAFTVYRTANINSLLYKRTEKIKEWPVYQNIHNHNIRNIIHRFNKAVGLHKFISTGIEQYMALHALWHFKSRYESLFSVRSQLLHKTFLPKLLQEKHRFFWYEKVHLEKLLGFLYNKAGLSKSLSYISQKNYAYKVIVKSGRWSVYKDIHNNKAENVRHRFDKAGLKASIFNKVSLLNSKFWLNHGAFLRKLLHIQYSFSQTASSVCIGGRKNFLCNRITLNKGLSYESRSQSVINDVYAISVGIRAFAQSPKRRLRRLALIPSCPSDGHISPYASIRSIWPPSGAFTANAYGNNFLWHRHNNGRSFLVYRTVNANSLLHKNVQKFIDWLMYLKSCQYSDKVLHISHKLSKTLIKASALNRPFVHNVRRDYLNQSFVRFFYKRLLYKQEGKAEALVLGLNYINKYVGEGRAGNLRYCIYGINFAGQDIRLTKKMIKINSLTASAEFKNGGADYRYFTYHRNYHRDMAAEKKEMASKQQKEYTDSKRYEQNISGTVINRTETFGDILNKQERADEIGRMIESKIQSSIKAISNQVYDTIEYRLRAEKRRRGM